MARLLAVDDHPIFLDGLVGLLSSQPSIVHVERAATGSQALERLATTPFDVAIVDIGLPDITGFDVIEGARAAGSDARFVLLTMYAEPAYVRRAEQVGASAYVLKDANGEELLQALHEVLQGRRYTSPAVQPSARIEATLDDLMQLTGAELRVLKALSKNQTSREIAEGLGTTLRTVQNHRANVCAKLGLRGANRLLEFALAHAERLRVV